MEARIQEAASLLEEEISHYEKLAAALKREAEQLRQGSPEDLLQSVKAVSAHAEAISQIHREARKKVEEMLPAAGEEKSARTLWDLIRLLPAQEALRLQRYQSPLDRLKNWVMEINSRNKAFIREALAHGQELFSLLNPGNEASPVYVPNGKRNPARQLPVSLDRKV